MFVRKKRNNTGSISIQVIDKSSGKYKVIKTIGCSKKLDVVEKLVLDAKKWIREYTGTLEIDFYNEKVMIESVLSNIEQITVQGTELLLGKLFDEVGFNIIDDEVFKQLVISRIIYPASKLKTMDFLEMYQAYKIEKDIIYRYLDKLHNSQKELIQQISYQHTLKILNNQISVVFYDVTTLYFEIDKEDELRKTGFSKEGKHQNPQIVLGLLVSIDSYPLAYEIFAGNKFEGHTMLPIIDSFKTKYKLDKLVIIADSGLLSTNNINELQNKKYEFILGARIKNETQFIKDKILSLAIKNGESKVIEKNNDTKLIISYSEHRAKKDKANREKGLKRLEKQIRTGRLTKSNINNRGYNKYLKMDGEIKITIDKEKFQTDQKWDGLKGYLTNTCLSKNDIIENYSHLWKIEKAFRISKNDLKIRPIYHSKQPRIEAHICISFVAYKIYKELERQLKLKKSGLSPEKAIEIAKTIYAIKVKLPRTKESYSKLIVLNTKQKELIKIFEL